MANEPTKLVRFRALCNVSLRPETDDIPDVYTAPERSVGVPAHVLTAGEEWHFKRTQAELDKLVRVQAIVILPAVSDDPGTGEEN